MSGPVELVLNTLPDAKQNATGWIARCPAHDDRTPSLSISEGDDGRALLFCHAGCPSEKIVSAIDLTMSDLFPPKNLAQRPARRLRRERSIVAKYDYRDESGALLYQVVRYAPKAFSQQRPDGSGGWIANLNGVRRVLYRLPELLASPSDRRVFVVEGEKDCNTLHELGAIATTNSGGAGKWLSEHTDILRNRPVVVIPDCDGAGREHASRVAQALRGTAASVRVLPLLELAEKGDVSDWIGHGGTLAELNRLADAAPEFQISATTPQARPLTDAGNAERFADQHADRFRFIPEWGSWIHFDGTRWIRDTAGTAKVAAIQTARTMLGTAESIESSDGRRAQAQHAIRSESSKAINAMLELARVDPRMIVRADALDAAQTRYLFNVQNGTLDVRTGELKAHDASHFITKLAPVMFDPSVLPSTWEMFMERVVPDPEVRAFLARFVGSTLTGDTGDQAFVLAHGLGCNGKSTMIAVLLRLLGDYGHQADFESFLQSTAHTDRRGGTRADLVAFRGVRFVAAIEAGDGRRLNETLVKSLTGGDTITARGPYDREQTSFVPQLHLLLSANERPQIFGTDHAIWRRVLNVEFGVTIPESERDASLVDRLTTPVGMSGLLNWALIGARDWYDTRTADRLRLPDTVRTSTADYREEQDVFAAFIGDRCERDATAWTSTKELRAAYATWCESSGEKAVSDRAFTSKLAAHGLRAERRGVPAARGWTGIRLRDA